jgi:hypothetical protein
MSRTAGGRLTPRGEELRTAAILQQVDTAWARSEFVPRTARRRRQHAPRRERLRQPAPSPARRVRTVRIVELIAFTQAREMREARRRDLLEVPYLYGPKPYVLPLGVNEAYAPGGPDY